ncbi:MAG: GldG family protein [Bacteroidales bacterium]
MNPYKNRIKSSILLVIVIIIGICWLSERYFIRLDFTADKRYTLSKATKDIIRNLPGTISITAYFTEDLPPDIAKVRQDFKEMLVEYYQVSKGKVVFNFIDPNENEGKEQEAIASGIQPAVVNVREKDQMKQQKIYLGAIIKMNDQSDVIPLIQPGAAMEYALSTGIKKVSVTNKPVIGYLQGDGEPPLEAMQQLMESMSVLYNLEPVEIHDSVYNLSEYPTLMEVDPVDSVSPAKLAQLDRYFSEGGNLILAVKGVEGNFNAMQGLVKETAYRSWLEKKGVILGKKFVIDGLCANIGVTQQTGGFTFQSQIPFPYLPLIKNFSEHPITRGMEQLILQFPTNLSFKPIKGISTEVLALTSDNSGLLEAPLTLSIDREWTDKDFGAAGQNVAAVVKGPEGADQWKMVVIAEGSFATNGTGQQAQAVQPDNISLMVNSVDWLSDQTGLMELRTKQVTSRPLDEVSDSRKAFIKYLNFLLPLILALGYGLYRHQRNKNIRMRRMQAGII